MGQAGVPGEDLAGLGEVEAEGLGGGRKLRRRE